MLCRPENNTFCLTLSHSCYLTLINCIPYLCSFPVTDSYLVRSRIGHTADRINYDVPKHLMQMVNMFVSLRNLPCFIPNDKIITCDTFLEKFRPNKRLSDGFFALDNCLNTRISRSTHGSDIEVCSVK
jgi:hypothetical protein